MSKKGKHDYFMHVLFALTYMLIIYWVYRDIKLKTDEHILEKAIGFLAAVLSTYFAYKIYKISKGRIYIYPFVAVCVSFGLEHFHVHYPKLGLILRLVVFSFLFSATYVIGYSLKKLKIPDTLYSVTMALIAWVITTIYVLSFFVKERISGYPSYFFLELASKELEYTYFMLRTMDVATIALVCVYPVLSLAAIYYVAKRIRQWFREKECENIKASWLLASAVAAMLVLSIPFTRQVILESEPVTYFIASYFVDMGSRMSLEKAEDYKPPLFEDKKNILFIIVDSLRADRIKAWGYHRDTLPKIDSFFKDSLKVKRFTTNIPSSYTSLKAIFTGDYPCFERKTHYTLFEAAKYNGYETAVFDSHSKYWQGKDMLYLNHGIDLYIDNKNPPKDAKWLVDGIVVDDYSTLQAANRWFSKLSGDKPYMALVFLQSVHHPYNIDDNNLTGFEPIYRPYYRKSDDIDLDKMMLPENTEINNRYDNSIRYADGIIYDFLERQKKDGRLKNTIIVFTADHGEALGEHQSSFHSTNVFDEQVVIPLYLKSDGIKSKTIKVGQNVDLFPTIMHLLKAQGNKDYQGYNLLDEKRTYEYFCHKIVTGVSDGNYKYIRNRITGKEELYNLKKDPDESQDLAARHPDIVKRYSNILAAFFRNPYDKPPA